VTFPVGATVDLQVHSTASDGSVAPGEIARIAAAAKLAAFALTDHDSVAGVGPATETAAAFGIRVIAGVELSAFHGDREIHILGLHIQSLSALDERLSTFRAQRIERAVLIVEKLRALNLPITIEDVAREAGGGAFGRPHIARALIAAKVVMDFRTAFDRYLGAGRPAYVPKPVLSVHEATSLIRATGGLSFWAHPGRDCQREILQTLVAGGLDGVEVLHPSHSADDIARIRTFCEQLGLLQSGGSDWHGEMAGGRTLGGMNVPAAWVDRHEERLAARSGQGAMGNGQGETAGNGQPTAGNGQRATGNEP
jgi:3',5'-nucleoside bisphosphate phosphatase